MGKKADREGRNGGLLNTGPTKEGQGGRPPKTDIIKLMAEMLDGDGYTIVEGTLLDDNGNSTGQKVKIRASVPNMQAAARAFMQNLKKGDTKTLQIFLDRTLGKVPQDVNMGGNMNFTFEGSDDNAIDTVLDAVKKAVK